MAVFNYPADLKYSETHEWVRVDGDTATIGITDYAQDQLGGEDIVHIEFTRNMGDVISQGDKFGDIESVKSASELFSPVSGEVISVNEALDEYIERIPHSPYEEGWMIKVKMSNPAETDKLMDAGKYQVHAEGS